jgi:enterobactin synthetase component D
MSSGARGLKARPVTATAEPYAVAWVRQVRFGVLAAVPLPLGKEPVPPEVLARLDPAEQAAAAEERGRRQIEFAGGRLAARAAAEVLGRGWGPLLRQGEDRNPVAPPGLTASITHKNELALALVAGAEHGLVGVDLEGDGRARLAISSRVCRPEELAVIEQLDEAARWPEVLVRFAVKEALYKAAWPRVQHFFGFHAARVERLPALRVTLELPPEDPILAVEAELEWLNPGQVIAMVRVR